MKLNYNCPASEKSGKGKGSCGGSKESDNATESVLRSKLERTLKSLEKDSKQHITKIHNLDGTTIDVESEIKQIKKQLEKMGNNTGNTISNIQNTKIINTKKTINSLIKTSPSTTSQEKYPTKLLNSKYYSNLNKKTTNIINNNKMNHLAIMTYVSDSNNITEFLIKGNKIINSNDSEDKKILDLEKKLDRPSKSSLQRIKIMDDMMKQSKLENNIIVHSGISKKLYDKINGSKSGKFSTPAYISASADIKVAEGFAMVREAKNGQNGYMMEIRVPAGVNAMAIGEFMNSIDNGKQSYVVGENGKIGGKGTQHEVLLDRGLTYRIIDRDESNAVYERPELRNSISFKIKKLIVEVVPVTRKNT